MVRALKVVKESSNTSNKIEQLRRSRRQHRAPERDNNFIMCSSTLDNILGKEQQAPISLILLLLISQIQDSPKGITKRRNCHRYDDSSDYLHSVQHSRRKIHKNHSLMEILEWRHQILEAPLRLLNEDISHKNSLTCQQHYSKNIAMEKIEKYGQHFQAVFINLNWQIKEDCCKSMRKLQLENHQFMRKGLVFLWVPKEYLCELLSIMQSKGFNYVENLQVIYLSYQKIQAEYHRRFGFSKNSIQVDEMLSSLPQTDPNSLILQSMSTYFKSSKQTLLIFRKVHRQISAQNSCQRLQLRHQRTCDVVFDIYNGQSTSIELKNYIYNMIETLLPDCLELKNVQGRYRFKMIELWADKQQQRRGWVQIVQK